MKSLWIGFSIKGSSARLACLEMPVLEMPVVVYLMVLRDSYSSVQCGISGNTV